MKLNLSVKYSLLVIVMLFVFTTTYTVVFITMHSNSQEKQLIEEGKYYCKILESSVAENLLGLRIDRIRENIIFLKHNPLLEYAYVIDKGGSIVSDGAYLSDLHLTIPNDNIHQNVIKSKSMLVQESNEILDISCPIQLGTQRLGYVRIGLSKNELNNEIADFRLTSILLGLLFIFSGSILSYFIIKTISKPLRKLTDLTYEISKGNFDKKISIETSDELNSLANAFNEMSTKLSHTQSSLINAKNEAERSNKLKTDFLAQISHEIRTPINTLLNYSSLIKDLLDSREKSETTEYFEIIGNAGKRIIRTIDLTLNMSEIIRGDFKPVFETFNINKDLLNGLYKEFQSAASIKSLNLIYEDDGKDYLVSTDKYTAAQIFQNLIDNAIKYTSSGYVKIKATENATGIVVSIIDSGEGISEEFQKSMYEEFRQEEQGYSRKYDGAGLGLSLVYKYCELTGVKIDVESKKGKGTTFNITFKKHLLSDNLSSTNPKFTPVLQ